MSMFDQFAGIGEGLALTRRPLLTLEQDKATSSASSAHGTKPMERKHGDPNNSYYNKCEKPDVGADWMNGRISAAALRTQKPYQSDSE